MVRIVTPDELLVPEGSRVLHIGPHKTGTTSLQVALYASRDEIARQGVQFVGYNRHPISAVLAILGRSAPTNDAGDVPGEERWRRIVAAMDEAQEPRTVLSSEFFADANDAAIRRVIDSVGHDQVQIVVTLRPLAKIIPSQWQQFVQSGATDAFEPWLHQLFEDPAAAKTFWRRHRPDRLVERWSEVVGPDRVTAVVVDDRDHSSVLRSFEHLLGLEDRTLSLEDGPSNRSLTRSEVEAVRRFNIGYWTAGLGMAQHTKVMRSGAAHYLQRRTPDATERKVLVPRWALDRAAEISEQIIENLDSSDIRLAGDLSLLRTQPIASEEVEGTDDVTVDPAVAGRLALGVLVASGKAPEARVDDAVFDVPDGTDLRARAVDAGKKAAEKARTEAAHRRQVEEAQHAAEEAVVRAERERLASLSPARRFGARALRSLSRRSTNLAERLTAP